MLHSPFATDGALGEVWNWAGVANTHHRKKIANFAAGATSPKLQSSSHNISHVAVNIPNIAAVATSPKLPSSSHNIAHVAVNIADIAAVATSPKL